jgi:Ca2+-binding EF-hand superfamily protein
MKAITFIAVACMSMWIANDVNAQQSGKNIQQDQGQEQAEGQQGKRGRKGRRGQRGAEGKSEEAGQGKGRGRRGGGQMLDMLLKRFDKDQNGAISLEEAPERMKQRFGKMDADGDKSISKAEIEAAFAKMQGGQNGKGQKRGKGKKGAKGEKGKGQKGKGAAGKRGREAMDFSKILEASDKDNDGMLSIDEAPERMKRAFDRIDADSSGTITSEELKSAMSKMKQRGGAKGRNKADEGKNKGPQKPKRPPMDNGGV